MANIYLNDQLYRQLSAKANQLNISVDQLVTDIISSVNLDRVPITPQSFQALFQDLLDRVRERCKQVLNGTIEKDEFSLRDVAEWNNTVKQASYVKNQITTPNGLRASLGRTFYSNVKARKIPNVIVAETIDKQGNIINKLDKYGVVIYKIISDEKWKTLIQSK